MKKDNSILDDLKYQMTYGNMVNKLVLVNGVVYVMILVVWIICNIFSPNLYSSFLGLLSVPSGLSVLYKPWTLFTYMISHEHFFHILFNLIGLWIFGNIFLTFFKEKQLLSVYILGGLAGAATYLLVANLLPQWGFGGQMIGASAAVTAILMAATTLRPDYEVSFVIIGRVKLKYITLAFVLFDLVGIATMNNTGGHFAHLGGLIVGFIYVKQLEIGNDLSKPMETIIDNIVNLFRGKRKGPKVVYRSPKIKENFKMSRPKPAKSKDLNSSENQEKLDQILDKIGATGRESLSKEEKEFLSKFKD